MAPSEQNLLKSLQSRKLTTLDDLLFVDVVVETRPGHIVLVERGVKPYGWALPGGLVDPGESLSEASIREVFEETGLQVKINRHFHTYRFMADDGELCGRSAVFLATGSGAMAGQSDVLDAKEYSLGSLPELIEAHERVVADYMKWVIYGTKPSIKEFLRGTKRNDLLEAA